MIKRKCDGIYFSVGFKGISDAGGSAVTGKIAIEHKNHALECSYDHAVLEKGGCRAVQLLGYSVVLSA